MTRKSTLKVVLQPQEFFHELVTTAMGAQKVDAAPETEFYLVNLLNQFMTTERLYTRDSEGHNREEPLAFLLKDALEQTEPQTQQLLFRQIGDVSLYTAGFFQDSLTRKLVDVDYYIDMGGNAYREASIRVAEKTVKTACEELAHKFSTFVDVLAYIADKTTSKKETDLLRMYDLYLRTGSERAAKALQEAGIDPAAVRANPVLKKKMQS